MQENDPPRGTAAGGCGAVWPVQGLWAVGQGFIASTPVAAPVGWQECSSIARAGWYDVVCFEWVIFFLSFSAEVTKNS